MRCGYAPRTAYLCLSGSLGIEVRPPEHRKRTAERTAQPGRPDGVIRRATADTAIGRERRRPDHRCSASLELWLLAVTPRRSPRRSREIVVALAHARLRLRPRLPARGASRPPRLVAVRAATRAALGSQTAFVYPPIGAFLAAPFAALPGARGRRPRHSARGPRGAGDPRPRRRARLALPRCVAALDADDLGDPPRHGHRRARARRRARLAVAGPRRSRRARPRARRRAQAVPLAARRLVRDHEAVQGRGRRGVQLGRLPPRAVDPAGRSRAHGRIRTG